MKGLTMSATTKKKRFVRKTEKQYEIVHFTLDFVEGDFALPSFKQVPLGVQRRVNKDPQVLYDFLEKHAEDGNELIEIIDTFDADENEAFMKSWADESGVDLGK